MSGGADGDLRRVVGFWGGTDVYRLTPAAVLRAD